MAYWPARCWPASWTQGRRSRGSARMRPTGWTTGSGTSCRRPLVRRATTSERQGRTGAGLLPMPYAAQRSRTSSALPVPAGRSNLPGRQERETRPVWTSTNSDARTRGTDTSLSRCSPTPQLATTTAHTREAHVAWSAARQRRSAVVWRTRPAPSSALDVALALSHHRRIHRTRACNSHYR